MFNVFLQTATAGQEGSMWTTMIGMAVFFEMEFEVPDVVRRSYIKQYDDCPYQFYMEHSKGIKQEANIYAQMGIDLHELFEKGSNEKL